MVTLVVDNMHQRGTCNNLVRLGICSKYRHCIVNLLFWQDRCDCLKKNRIFTSCEFCINFDSKFQHGNLCDPRLYI